MSLNLYRVYVTLMLVGLINCDLCPDKKIRCGKGQTCCSDNQGSYGCCPYESATCCADGSHCCPNQTTCDVEHGRCLPQMSQVTPWTMIQEAPIPHHFQQENALEQEISEGANLKNLTMFNNVGQKCPDGDRKCAETYTCCPLTTGGYGCCPFQKAQCCPDKVHCCPNGQSCNSAANGCQ